MKKVGRPCSHQGLCYVWILHIHSEPLLRSKWHFILTKTTGQDAGSLRPSRGASWSSASLLNFFRITVAGSLHTRTGSPGGEVLRKHCDARRVPLYPHLVPEVPIQSHPWSLFFFNLMLIDLSSCVKIIFLLIFLSVPIYPSNKSQFVASKIIPWLFVGRNSWLIPFLCLHLLQCGAL